MPTIPDTPVSIVASDLPNSLSIKALAVIITIIVVVRIIIHYTSPTRLTNILIVAMAELKKILGRKVSAIQAETLKDSHSYLGTICGFLKGRTFTVLLCIWEVEDLERQIKANFAGAADGTVDNAQSVVNGGGGSRDSGSDMVENRNLIMAVDKRTQISGSGLRSTTRQQDSPSDRRPPKQDPLCWPQQNTQPPTPPPQQQQQQQPPQKQLWPPQQPPYGQPYREGPYSRQPPPPGNPSGSNAPYMPLRPQAAMYLSPPPGLPDPVPPQSGPYSEPSPMYAPMGTLRQPGPLPLPRDHREHEQCNRDQEQRERERDCEHEHERDWERERDCDCDPHEFAPHSPHPLLAWQAQPPSSLPIPIPPQKQQQQQPPSSQQQQGGPNQRTFQGQFHTSFVPMCEALPPPHTLPLGPPRKHTSVHTHLTSGKLRERKRERDRERECDRDREREREMYAWGVPGPAPEGEWDNNLNANPNVNGNARVNTEVAAAVVAPRPCTSP
ncbi:hypothetical protein B0H19DRAFT_1061228 [Mycena capillaripes]|nr:hypothetical protein B0H19DRAFT_1061228 [Mycena capillaripes]